MHYVGWIGYIRWMDGWVGRIYIVRWIMDILDGGSLGRQMDGWVEGQIK